MKFPFDKDSIDQQLSDLISTGVSLDKAIVRLFIGGARQYFANNPSVIPDIKIIEELWNDYCQQCPQAEELRSIFLWENSLTLPENWDSFEAIAYAGVMGLPDIFYQHGLGELTHRHFEPRHERTSSQFKMLNIENQQLRPALFDTIQPESFDVFAINHEIELENSEFTHFLNSYVGNTIQYNDVTVANCAVDFIALFERKLQNFLVSNPKFKTQLDALDGKTARIWLSTLHEIYVEHLTTYIKKNAYAFRLLSKTNVDKLEPNTLYLVIEDNKIKYRTNRTPGTSFVELDGDISQQNGELYQAIQNQNLSKLSKSCENKLFSIILSKGHIEEKKALQSDWENFNTIAIPYLRDICYGFTAQDNVPFNDLASSYCNYARNNNTLAVFSAANKSEAERQKHISPIATRYRDTPDKERPTTPAAQYLTGSPSQYIPDNREMNDAQFTQANIEKLLELTSNGTSIDGLLRQFYLNNALLIQKNYPERFNTDVYTRGLQRLWDGFINDPRLQQEDTLPLREKLVAINSQIHERIAEYNPQNNIELREELNHSFYLDAIQKIVSTPPEQTSEREKSFAKTFEAVTLLWLHPELFNHFDSKTKEQLQNLCESKTAKNLEKAVLLMDTDTDAVNAVFTYYHGETNGILNASTLRNTEKIENRNKVIHIVTKVCLQTVSESVNTSRLLNKGAFKLDSYFVPKELDKLFEKLPQRIASCKNLDSEFIAVTKDVSRLLLKDFRHIFGKPKQFNAFIAQITDLAGSDLEKRNQLICNMLVWPIARMANLYVGPQTTVSQQIIYSMTYRIQAFFNQLANKPEFGEQDFYSFLKKSIEHMSLSDLGLNENTSFSDVTFMSIDSIRKSARTLPDFLAIKEKLNPNLFTVEEKEAEIQAAMRVEINMELSPGNASRKVGKADILKSFVEVAGELAASNQSHVLHSLTLALPPLKNVSTSFYKDRFSDLLDIDDAITNNAYALGYIENQLNALPNFSDKNSLFNILYSDLPEEEKLKIFEAVGKAKIKNEEALSGELKPLYLDLSKVRDNTVENVISRFSNKDLFFEFAKKLAADNKNDALYRLVLELPLSDNEEDFFYKNRFMKSLNHDYTKMHDHDYILGYLEEHLDKLPEFGGEKSIRQILARDLPVLEKLKILGAIGKEKASNSISTRRSITNSSAQNFYTGLSHFQNITEANIDKCFKEFRKAIHTKDIDHSAIQIERNLQHRILRESNREAKNFETQFTRWLNFSNTSKYVMSTEDLASIPARPTPEQLESCAKQIQNIHHETPNKPDIHESTSSTSKSASNFSKRAAAIEQALYNTVVGAPKVTVHKRGNIVSQDTATINPLHDGQSAASSIAPQRGAIVSQSTSNITQSKEAQTYYPVLQYEKDGLSDFTDRVLLGQAKTALQQFTGYYISSLFRAHAPQGMQDAIKQINQALSSDSAATVPIKIYNTLRKLNEISASKMEDNYSMLAGWGGPRSEETQAAYKIIYNISGKYSYPSEQSHDKNRAILGELITELNALHAKYQNLQKVGKQIDLSMLIKTSIKGM